MRNLIGVNVSKSLFRYCSSSSSSYKPVKRAVLSSKSVNSKFLANDNAKKTVALSKQLEAKISATGPITVADYMREVLTNPAKGYYMWKDVFGEKGDFITSPEIGQIFGELMAIWCISEWEKCGSSVKLQIIELGPGRGTLSEDILRVFNRFNLSRNISLHLVEASPFLSELQWKRICSHSNEIKISNQDLCYRKGETASGIPVYWYHKLDDVPTGFSIFLANEFFDALPIHKFQLVDGKWREILVDLDRSKENVFRFVSAKAPTPMLNLFLSRPWVKSVLNDRNHIEYSAETERIIELMAKRLEEDGGIGLIVDYGHTGEKSDTFRAFKGHGLHDPLVEPGTADLTADVDFSHLKLAAENYNQVITFGPIEQRDFLNRMGGEIRLKTLLDNAKSNEAVQQLKTGYEMLTSSSKMGSRFKCFAMFPKVLEDHLKKYPVAGF